MKNEIPPRLRVMSEYESSGIWAITSIGPFRHGMIDYTELSLPSDLANRFDNWIGTYYGINKPDFDIESFNETGRDLAQELKSFLGAEIYVEFQPRTIEGSLGDPEVIE